MPGSVPRVDRSEKLDIHIDGITYMVPRREFKSGQKGFRLLSGALVHGRKAWIKVLVMDVPDRTPEEAARRKARNRANKQARKGMGLRK